MCAQPYTLHSVQSTMAMICAFQAGGGAPVSARLTPRLIAEFMAVTPCVSTALSTPFVDVHSEAVRSILVGLGFPAADGPLPTPCDVPKCNVEGLHMGKHAGLPQADAIAARVRSLPAQTIAAIVGVLIDEMSDRFRSDCFNMAHVHVRANLQFCLHLDEYDAVVGTAAPCVDVGALFNHFDIVVCFEAANIGSAVSDLPVQSPRVQYDAHNPIVLASNCRVAFIDGKTLLEMAIEEFMMLSLRLRTGCDESTLRSIIVRCKAARFVAASCGELGVAVVGLHLKYVDIAPDVFAGGYAAFCAIFCASLLRALQTHVTDADIDPLQCRLVGDLNLQTRDMGAAAVAKAAETQCVLYNSGSVGSVLDPARLELTAFNAIRQLAGTEQLSKAGQSREKPSMCIVAPDGACGRSGLLRKVDKTPCKEWPWDHMAVHAAIRDPDEPDSPAAVRARRTLYFLVAIVCAYFVATLIVLVKD